MFWWIMLIWGLYFLGGATHVWWAVIVIATLFFQHILISNAQSKAKEATENMVDMLKVLNEEENKKPKPKLQKMDKTLIKDLIVFCHPDKHGGSDKAKRLTQELIKLRDKV